MILTACSERATRARGAREIEIVNLGLEPWEAVQLGLEVEDVENGDRLKPVADYVLSRHDGKRWRDWLQGHRVELNAMTTPRFIEWLDAKMAEHGDGKLIPPAEVLQQAFELLEERMRDDLPAHILAEANLEAQVRQSLRAIKQPKRGELLAGVKKLFERAPEQEWRDHIEEVTSALVRGSEATHHGGAR